MIKKRPELARDKARKGLGRQYGAKWRHVADSYNLRHSTVEILLQSRIHRLSKASLALNHIFLKLWKITVGLEH